jgi:hypothetical protein
MPVGETAIRIISPLWVLPLLTCFFGLPRSRLQQQGADVIQDVKEVQAVDVPDQAFEARRWVADEAPTEYFCTYSTDRFEALSSPAYKKGLANPDRLAKKHILRFQNFGRVVGRIMASRGWGRGAALGVVRLRPSSEGKDALGERLRELVDPGVGIVEGLGQLRSLSTRCIEMIPGSIRQTPARAIGIVLIDGTELAAVRSLIESRFRRAAPLSRIG